MFVISMYSRRARGHVVALGLLAVVANGVGRLARMRLQEAGLDPFSVGGRLAEDFGGYLVTEPEHKVWRGAGGRVVLLGAARFTGMNRIEEMDCRGWEVGALDAPEFLPAGGCEQYSLGGGEVCANGGAVLRDGWRE